VRRTSVDPERVRAIARLAVATLDPRLRGDDGEGGGVMKEGLAEGAGAPILDA